MEERIYEPFGRVLAVSNDTAEILLTLDSGLTLLDIETGFDAQNQKALLVVIYAKKYPAIKEAALSIDPSAFIIASEVTGVNGRGYTLQRSYSTKAK